MGRSDRWTSGSPKRVSVDATTRSQAGTTSMPPPRAKPSTAAISGLVRFGRMIPYSPPRIVGDPAVGRSSSIIDM
jgi:hypothetical protein